MWSTGGAWFGQKKQPGINLRPSGSYLLFTTVPPLLSCVWTFTLPFVSQSLIFRNVPEPVQSVLPPGLTVGFFAFLSVCLCLWVDKDLIFSSSSSSASLALIEEPLFCLQKTKKKKKQASQATPSALREGGGSDRQAGRQAGRQTDRQAGSRRQIVVLWRLQVATERKFLRYFFKSLHQKVDEWVLYRTNNLCITEVTTLLRFLDLYNTK